MASSAMSPISTNRLDIFNYQKRINKNAINDNMNTVLLNIDQLIVENNMQHSEPFIGQTML